MGWWEDFKYDFLRPLVVTIACCAVYVICVLLARFMTLRMQRAMHENRVEFLSELEAVYSTEAVTEVTELSDSEVVEEIIK